MGQRIYCLVLTASGRAQADDGGRATDRRGRATRASRDWKTVAGWSVASTSWLYTAQQMLDWMREKMCVCLSVRSANLDISRRWAGERSELSDRELAGWRTMNPRWLALSDLLAAINDIYQQNNAYIDTDIDNFTDILNCFVKAVYFIYTCLFIVFFCSGNSKLSDAKNYIYTL